VFAAGSATWCCRSGLFFLAWSRTGRLPEMAAVASQLPDDALRAFVTRLRRRHARMSAARSALRAFLPWGALGAAALWIAPDAAAVLAGAGALLAAVAGWWAARKRLPDHLLLAGVEGAPEVHDALSTWIERRGAAAPPVVSAWLAEDLWQRASAMPARAWTRVGRRPLGAVRWLLPLLVLLVWGRLLVEGVQLPLPGAGGGSAAGGGGAAARAPSPGAPSQLPDPPPPVPELPQQEEVDPPPPPPQPDPLLELPPQEQFVVPQFVGDGPSRKAMAERAEVELGGGGAAKPRPQQAGGAAGSDVPPPAREFERAAERAERARNVPAEERPMVRRFFELLRKEGS